MNFRNYFILNKDCSSPPFGALDPPEESLSEVFGSRVVLGIFMTVPRLADGLLRLLVSSKWILATPRLVLASPTLDSLRISTLDSKDIENEKTCPEFGDD